MIFKMHRGKSASLNYVFDVNIAVVNCKPFVVYVTK